MNAFAFLFGSWAVRHRRLRERLVASTDWEEFEGTTVCAPILAGVGNFEQVRMPSRSAIGSTLRLFDRQTGLWSIYWSSSLTGRLDPPMIGMFSDGVGTFFGENTHQGQPVCVRFAWDNISDIGARWSQAFAAPGTASWETNWIMDLTRISHQAHAASTSDDRMA
jgi:hypothetical protein